MLFRSEKEGGGTEREKGSSGGGGGKRWGVRVRERRRGALLMEWKGGTGAPGGGGRCAPLPSAFGVEVGDEDGVTVGTTGSNGPWRWAARLLGRGS